MNPILSIIVPIYNVKEYLEKCIDSILNQSFKNFELILVDDGSIDGSEIICDEYALKDNRIKVIHKENGGQSSARNMGLDIARGKYIGFIDSDDSIQEEMYEDMLKEMNKNFDLVICGRSVIDKNKKKSNINIKSKEYRFQNNKKRVDYLCREFIFPHTVSTCNKLYKKYIIDKINLRFEDLRKIGTEDTLFNYNYILNIDSIKSIDKNYYIQYAREGSTMRSYNPGYLERFGNLMTSILNSNFEKENERVNVIFCIYFFQVYINHIKGYSEKKEFYKKLKIELDYLKKNKEFIKIVKKIIFNNFYIKDLKSKGYGIKGVIYIKLLYLTVYLKLYKLSAILLK